MFNAQTDTSIFQVPINPDVIIIGGGVSGLATGATLSKAGKRVLVLEKYHSLGGGTSTQTVKGTEFEIGTYFLGDLKDSIFKTCLDQLTEGQVEVVQLDNVQDNIYIGAGDDRRMFEIRSGAAWAEKLVAQFPGEKPAIDRFMGMVDEVRNWMYIVPALKVLPLWLVKLVISSRLLNLCTPAFEKKYRGLTIKDVVEDLTENRDLREVLAFRWNVYTLTPDELPFVPAAVTDVHWTTKRSYFPAGGASEIPFHMIPVIEQSGGAAFASANVENILFDGKHVKGVTVRDERSVVHAIFAPRVVSTIGLIESINRLIPRTVVENSQLKEFAKRVNTGCSFFAGQYILNGTKEDLKLTSASSWQFEYNDLGQRCRDWLNKNVEKALEEPLPMMAFNSNSAKEPKWNRDENHIGKSTMNVITVVSWNWFARLKTLENRKIGPTYEKIRDAFGIKMTRALLNVLPQLKDRIEHAEFATPLRWADEYLGKHEGSWYGLKHDSPRFDDPMFVARLRPETDIPGFYLSGQDMLFTGVTSNLCSGVMSAGAILERNTLFDLARLHLTATKSVSK